MRRRSRALGLAALLAGLLAGCEGLSCLKPSAPPAAAAWTAPAGTEAEERGAEQVYDQANERYRSQYELFIPERDYDVIIAQLRQGLATYPRTTWSPKLQLMLADVCFEKRKYFNHKELTLFGGGRGEIGFDTASRAFLPFDEAIAEYEKVAAQWPDPQCVEAQTALTRIGDLLLEEYNPARDPARALTYYERLLRDYPKSVNEDWILFKIANTYRLLNDSAHAALYYRRLVDEYPGFPTESLIFATNYIANHPVPGAPAP